jgi:F0F1-type ATP synthase membrane subunit b/b'
MKKSISFMVLAALLAAAVAVVAQKPGGKVSNERHPYLAAAQHFTKQAYDKIVAAQRANEWDLGGHAEKAKTLLEQANVEIKLAAEAANANHR